MRVGRSSRPGQTRSSQVRSGQASTHSLFLRTAPRRPHRQRRRSLGVGAGRGLAARGVATQPARTVPRAAQHPARRPAWARRKCSRSAVEQQTAAGRPSTAARRRRPWQMRFRRQWRCASRRPCSRSCAAGRCRRRAPRPRQCPSLSSRCGRPRRCSSAASSSTGLRRRRPRRRRGAPRPPPSTSCAVGHRRPAPRHRPSSSSCHAPPARPPARWRVRPRPGVSATFRRSRCLGAPGCQRTTCG